MTEAQKAFIDRLYYEIYEKLTDEMEKAIVYMVCRQLQLYYLKRSETKTVEKGEMLEYLTEKGLLKPGNNGKPPNDRAYRKCQRQLLRRGIPLDVQQNVWYMDCGNGERDRRAAAGEHEPG